MATHNGEILLCVYGGGVREVSGNVGLTSLTSTPGMCDVANRDCTCTRVMEPKWYRVGPYGTTAMWIGGLNN